MLKFLFVLLFSTLAFADIINIDEKSDSLEILSYSKIYIDKTRSLDIDKIKQVPIAFKDNNKTQLSFGYSPNFDLWVKFTIKNTTNKKITRILEYESPIVTNITLYDIKYDKVYNEGALQVNTNRKTTNPYFIFNLEANEEKTYYLKASAHITSLKIGLKVWKPELFYNEKLEYQSILQWFFGAMLILAIYNLFIYFYSKDHAYLFYVLYLIGITYHHLSYTGLYYIYFDKGSTIFLLEYISFFIAFPFIMLALFLKSFLKLSQYKKIDKSLNIILILVFISLILNTSLESLDQYKALPSVILLIFLIFITIYACIKRNRQAYFIIAGWIIMFISMMSMYLSSIGVFSVNNLYKYFIEIGILAESILFSLALADKINYLQKQRDISNKMLEQQKQTEEDRLKQEIENKTLKLQTALKKQTTLLQELNHRVKNNMQVIISLIRLQADKIDDEEVQDIFTTIQNRINAMAYLHELLYKKNDITDIDTHQYFKTLIESLQASFENNIDITYNINHDLKIETAISCGLILNELIVNSFKYAFDNNVGEITVEMYKKGDNLYFNISDNGKGYDKEVNRDSLGLILVQTIVKSHLKGSIKTNTQNGVTNKIMWSA